MRPGRVRGVNFRMIPENLSQVSSPKEFFRQVLWEPGVNLSPGYIPGRDLHFFRLLELVADHS